MLNISKMTSTQGENWFVVYRVTLLGESAGSASVTYHMLSDLSARKIFVF